MNLDCTVTAHQESLHCACARWPRQSQHQFINLWLKDSLENSSYTVGETKVSVIPLRKFVSVEPVSSLFPKLYLDYKSTLTL